MNENVKRKAAIAFLISALSLPFISAVLRTLNIFFFFDSQLGYYQRGAILPLISNIILGIGALVLIALAFVFFKKSAISYCTHTRTEAVISYICAAVVGFVAVFVLLSSASAAVKDFSSIVSEEKNALTVHFIKGAEVFLTLVCALYFVIAIQNIKPILKVLAGILAIVRLTIMLGSSYFNSLVQMNAPDKLLFGLACVFSMLFIASELKVFAENPRPHIYLISASLTMALGLTSALPSVIAYHSGRLPKNNGLYFEYYLLLALALYSGVRLTLQMIKLIRAKKEADIPLTENDISCEDDK